LSHTRVTGQQQRKKKSSFRSRPFTRMVFGIWHSCMVWRRQLYISDLWKRDSKYM